MAERRARRSDADPARGAAAMSLPLAGALACWLSVSAMLLAPQLRLPRVRLGRDHPDAAALHDAGWARPLWQWEAARGVIALVSIAIALAAGIPAAPAAAAAAIAPSIAVRVRAAAAQRRSRIATTRLLRVTEATLRASGGIAEALRRAVAACDDPLARAPFEESLRAFSGQPKLPLLRQFAGRSRLSALASAASSLAKISSADWRSVVVIGSSPWVADQMASMRSRSVSMRRCALEPVACARRSSCSRRSSPGSRSISRSPSRRLARPSRRRWDGTC